MNQFTPDQKSKLVSWAEQRDTILREIGNAKIELDSINLSKKDAAISHTEISGRISEAKGRLAEIDAAEDRYRLSIATDIAELIARKSRLESEIETKTVELKSIDEKKNLIIEMITTLTNVHDKVFDRATAMDALIGHVVEIAQKHVSDTNGFMRNLGNAFQKMIDRGELNVKQTNIVLEKLPKYIFELQRPIPVRRIPNQKPITPDPIKQP